jgi:hypothetical protein
MHRLAGAPDACCPHAVCSRPDRRNNWAHPSHDARTTSALRFAPARAGKRRADDARGGRGRPAGRADKRLPSERRRGHTPLAVRARAQRRLARLACRPPPGLGRGPRRAQLPDVHADHVRELRAGARDRAHVEHARAAGRRRVGASRPPARPPAGLPGCVRLPRVRAYGRVARPRPLHAHRRRSAERPGVQVRRVAVPALALRPPVHARQLRDRPARARRRAVGVQGAVRRGQPRGGRADRAHL